MKHLGDAVNELVDRVVVQDLIVDLKEAQDLQPNHAGKRMRKVEEALRELIALGIILDPSSDLKAHLLMQHSDAEMQRRRLLNGCENRWLWTTDKLV